MTSLQLFCRLKFYTNFPYVMHATHNIFSIVLVSQIFRKEYTLWSSSLCNCVLPHVTSYVPKFTSKPWSQTSRMCYNNADYYSWCLDRLCINECGNNLRQCKFLFLDELLRHMGHAQWWLSRWCHTMVEALLGSIMASSTTSVYYKFAYVVLTRYAGSVVQTHVHAYSFISYDLWISSLLEMWLRVPFRGSLKICFLL
jgi:hypothetical protein